MVLVGRALWPALRQRTAQRPLLLMLLISTIAIGGFYFAALGAGRHTNLAVAEYWRWWVVHLWVEGFFEVFATVIIAFLFARLGLVGHAAAGRPSVLAATIFLGGGVIGTLHHLIDPVDAIVPLADRAHDPRAPPGARPRRCRRDPSGGVIRRPRSTTTRTEPGGVRWRGGSRDRAVGRDAPRWPGVPSPAWR